MCLLLIVCYKSSRYMLTITYSPMYYFHHLHRGSDMVVLKSLAALDVLQMRALHPPDSLWLPLFFIATL